MRAPLHFFGRDIFHMLREAPLVSERIGDFSIAVAPELVFQGHIHLGACGHGPLANGIHIFGLEEDATRILNAGRWRGVHTGELVREHHHGVADS